ncbi:MAG: AAA family ATPase, partial [Clostridia bacterium]
MLITKCYIENFGKHSQFEFDFTSGMNAIIQDNGWGKSTLAIFIKA